MNRSAAPGQRELWGLAAITLCGLALRMVEAGSQPLWTDEALTLVIAEWPTRELLLKPVDPTAGLYYVLHQLLVPDGAGVEAIRGISIAAGTLSIPAIYAVARLGIGRSAGLLAAALLAIAPALVDYSQEARAYALQVFLVLLSAAGLLGWARRLGEKGGTAALLLFAVATVLAFSTHLSGIFWVLPAVPLAAWVTLRRGTARQKRAFALALGAMALGALPELVRLFWRARLGGGFVWLEQASAPEALGAWSDTLLPTSTLLGNPLAHLLLAAFVAVVAWRLLAHRDQLRDWAREKPASAAVLAILTLSPVAVWLFGFVLVPIFMPRTILIGILGFILLVCLADRLEKGRVVAIAAILLFGFASIASGPMRAREDWAGVAAPLARAARPGDAIVHCAAWKYPALRHAAPHAQGNPHLFLLDRRMVHFEPGAEGWQRTYFRTVLEPPMRHIMGEQARLPLAEAGLPPFARAWVVESECGADALARTRQWLGKGRWSLVRASPPTRHHAGIRLRLFEASAPQSRPVHVVTD